MFSSILRSANAVSAHHVKNLIKPTRFVQMFCTDNNAMLNVSPATRKKKTAALENVHMRDLNADVARVQRQIVQAVEHMAPLNETFTIEFKMVDGLEWLIISTPRGKFQFHADHSQNCLMFISYITGYHGYHYYPEEKLWLSKKSDRHDMRGMITRDFIHHCVGCPDFNHM